MKGKGLEGMCCAGMKYTEAEKRRGKEGAK
jgi:hypothetical protein